MFNQYKTVSGRGGGGEVTQEVVFVRYVDPNTGLPPGLSPVGG